MQIGERSSTDFLHDIKSSRKDFHSTLGEYNRRMWVATLKGTFLRCFVEHDVTLGARYHRKVFRLGEIDMS